MEAILPELEIGLGVCLSALALVVLAFGGILMGHLADLEKAGKRFFWTESPVPGPELRTFLPREVEILHAA
ncbi:MAG: hypothetical protein ACHQPI_00810 [Thermoanaerobaculia bacterium]